MFFLKVKGIFKVVYSKILPVALLSFILFFIYLFSKYMHIYIHTHTCIYNMYV